MKERKKRTILKVLRLQRFKPEKCKKIGSYQIILGRAVATDSRGYFVDRNGQLVHRKIYIEAFGPIPKDWVVHHIDMDKKNFQLENLIALPARFHADLHTEMKEKKTVYGRTKVTECLLDYFSWVTNSSV